MPTHSARPDWVLTGRSRKRSTPRWAMSRVDVRVTGIVVFLTALVIFVAVLRRSDVRHGQADQRAA